jgi:hypothetical protein
MDGVKNPGIVMLILIFLLTIISVHSVMAEEVVGVVLSVKGDLIQTCDNTKEELKPGTKIYKNSVITLSEGTQRGKLQIGSNSGPVVYTRFPVSFDKTTFMALSVEQQDNYISCIGGSVLRSKGIKNETEIIEWYIAYLGALGENDLKEGFSLVFSKNKRSDENLIINPLYIKFKEGVKIQNASFNIINKDEKTIVCERAHYNQQGGDYTIQLHQITYEFGIAYAIEAVFLLFDGRKEKVRVTFYVYGDEEIAFIEEEAKEMFSEGMSDYEKNLIRAGRYRYYEMTLKAFEILKSIGVDLDGML